MVMDLCDFFATIEFAQAQIKIRAVVATNAVRVRRKDLVAGFRTARAR
jgi:hypothetical protein